MARGAPTLRFGRPSSQKNIRLGYVRKWLLGDFWQAAQGVRCQTLSRHYRQRFAERRLRPQKHTYSAASDYVRC
jgi:hypothetical protein